MEVQVLSPAPPMKPGLPGLETVSANKSLVPFDNNFDNKHIMEKK